VGLEQRVDMDIEPCDSALAQRQGSSDPADATADVQHPPVLRDGKHGGNARKLDVEDRGRHGCRERVEPF
jgi:hypothetical protein